MNFHQERRKFCALTFLMLRQEMTHFVHRPRGSWQWRRSTMRRSLPNRKSKSTVPSEHWRHIFRIRDKDNGLVTVPHLEFRNTNSRFFTSFENGVKFCHLYYIFITSFKSHQNFLNYYYLNRSTKKF